MNRDIEEIRAEYNARIEQLDNEINAYCKANSIPFELHHELGCKIDKPQVLADHFADREKRADAVETLDYLTVADLRDLRDDLIERNKSLKGCRRDAMERLLKEVEARIANKENEE